MTNARDIDLERRSVCPPRINLIKTPAASSVSTPGGVHVHNSENPLEDSVKLTRKNFSQAPAIKIVNLILVIAFALSAVALSAGQQAANTINTIAGGGTTPSSPLSLDLPGPTAVLKDGQGNLYITAPASAYVFELTAGGTVQNYTGLGWGYFAGAGGLV